MSDGASEMRILAERIILNRRQAEKFIFRLHRIPTIAKKGN